MNVRLLAIWAVFGFGLSGCNPAIESPWKIVHHDDASDSPGSTFLSISFVGSGHGLAVTSDSLQETNDGGKTWIKRIQASENPLSVFNSFIRLDTSKLLILGSQRCASNERGCGLIWITSDGGQTWTKLASSKAQNIINARFCSSNNGWALGSNISADWKVDSVVLHTVDGGTTWTEPGNKFDAQYDLSGISSFGCQEVLAVGSGGIILHTKDDGKNWLSRKSDSSARLLCVRYFDNEAWAVGTNGTLLRSDDRGVSWRHVLLETKETLMDIQILGSRGWIVGTNGIILSTFDRGNVWRIQDSGTTNDLYSLAATDDSVWAGGARLTVLRLDLSN